MSGIDRIGGGIRPEGPEGPDRTERKKAEGPAFAGKLESSAPQSGAAPATGGTFPTLRDRILEGVDADLEREEILGNIVADEVERTFGDQGTEEMSRSVTESFRGNDQLWTLFNRLYQAAVEDRA